MSNWTPSSAEVRWNPFPSVSIMIGEGHRGSGPLGSHRAAAFTADKRQTATTATAATTVVRVLLLSLQTMLLTLGFCCEFLNSFNVFLRFTFSLDMLLLLFQF